MHPAAHAFTKLDPTPAPGEEHIVAVFRSCPDCDASGVEQLRAAGVSWGTILSLVIKYGTAFKEVLQVILAALQAEPPESRAAGHRKAGATQAQRQQEEEDEEGKAQAPPRTGQREDKSTRDTTPSSPPSLTAKDLQPKKPEVKGEPPSKAK